MNKRNIDYSQLFSISAVIISCINILGILYIASIGRI